jgi:site-specific DNA recombinase
MIRAALYARFSTDRQSESSIEDQYRVCTAWCEGQNVKVVARFEDQGISGAAIGNRPGLQALLIAQVDVVLVMDLTRLSRSQADLPKLIDRFMHRGVRVVGAQDGYDSARKGHKLQAGLAGIIGESFREMISDRTYAALESRAIKGAKTGGRAYGYSIADSGHIINADEAAVVVEIFDWYAEGHGARWIAAELNRRGVTSPGASWARIRRRRGGWHPSAISGSPARGIGILCNELYIGRDTWNRSKWIKDPDSGARRCVQRPRSEWIVRDVPELRIISQQLWDRVKARQAQRAGEVGDRVRSRLKKGMGRAPRYLLSSLLKCSHCGSNYVMANRTHYACSGFVNGAICTNDVRIRRDSLENRLLSAIRTALLTDDNIEKFKRQIVAGLKRPDPDSGHRAKLDAEIEQLVGALAQGIRSRAVIERLEATEAERDRLRAAGTVLDFTAMMASIPRAVELYKAKVASLGDAIRETDVERARQVIKDTCGDIIIVPENGGAVAEIGLNSAPAAIFAGAGKIGLVAGVGFEPTTFGL